MNDEPVLILYDHPRQKNILPPKICLQVYFKYLPSCLRFNITYCEIHIYTHRFNNRLFFGHTRKYQHTTHLIFETSLTGGIG